MRTARSLALMFLAPPVMLLLWAQMLPRMGFWGDTMGLLLACAVGLAGVLTGPWSSMAKAITTLFYVALLVFAMPFLGLMAACSTGNCL